MIPLLVFVGVLAALGLSACGSDDESGGSGGDLLVSAASSLQDAFDAYGERFDAAEIKPSYAGSDELAAQIRNGLTPDVYAAAETDLPQRLFEDGLVGEPVVFAGNRLVIAVPADGDAGIESIEDVAKPGVDLVIGAMDVPVGAYTLEVLDKLPAVQHEGILANVRSEEPEVSAVIGKLTQGAADAGFVYATDVPSAGDDLRTIALPDELQPEVAYGAAVVSGASNPQAAREFIDGLVEGPGQEALRDAGFLPPP